MSKPSDLSSDLPDRDEIEAVAAVWLSLRDRGMSSAETTEFMRWLQQDPAHAAAFADLESAWRDVGRLAVVRSDADSPPDRDLLAPRPRPRRRRGPFVAALAAAAAVAVGIFIGHEATITRATAVTTVGSFQKIDLPDGSVVQLNTDSALDFEFSGKTRQVRLRRGEAHFEVAKDPSRPFFVSAGGISVRAIGTAFNIRLRGADVEVLVTEGRIGVRSAESKKKREEPAAAAALELSAGEITLVPQAQVAAAKVTEIAAPQVRRTLAWQERRIEFDAMPLASVVAEFNRYNRCRLVISDRTLAAKPFTGVFRADEYQTFVRILETTFGVRAERRPDEIRLQPGR